MFEDDYSAPSLMKSAPVKLALGFAAFVVVLAVAIGPSANTLVASVVKPDLGPVDTMTTATVRKPEKKRRYILRRSVLQKDRDAECRIFVSGRREGDC